MKKYKVTGSFLDRTYYSKVFEIYIKDLENESDIKDYLKYITQMDESEIFHNWNNEGSEDAGGGFNISSIEAI